MEKGDTTLTFTYAGATTGTAGGEASALTLKVKVFPSIVSVAPSLNRSAFWARSNSIPARCPYYDDGNNTPYTKYEDLTGLFSAAGAATDAKIDLTVDASEINSGDAITVGDKILGHDADLLQVFEAQTLGAHVGNTDIHLVEGIGGIANLEGQRTALVGGNGGGVPGLVAQGGGDAFLGGQIQAVFQITLGRVVARAVR